MADEEIDSFSPRQKRNVRDMLRMRRRSPMARLRRGASPLVARVMERASFSAASTGGVVANALTLDESTDPLTIDESTDTLTLDD
jgi:hypothetical protein